MVNLLRITSSDFVPGALFHVRDVFCVLSSEFWVLGSEFWVLSSEFFRIAASQKVLFFLL